MSHRPTEDWVLIIVTVTVCLCVFGTFIASIWRPLDIKETEMVVGIITALIALMSAGLAIKWRNGKDDE